MNDDELVREIDASLANSDAELEATLPELLAGLDGRMEDLLRDRPETVGRVVQRMKTMDVASFVADDPDTADRFQNLLWTGVTVLVENSPALREQIDDDITVSFEADDCPMTGHLVIDEDERTMRGGAGRLEDPMLEITGPAETIVGLIVGNVDPIRGYIRQQYEMDGPIHKGTRLAPIVTSLSEQFPAEREDASD